MQFIMLKVLLSCVLTGETFFIPLPIFLTWLLEVSSSYICHHIHPISTPLNTVIQRYGVGFHAAVESKDESTVTDFLFEVMSTVSQAHMNGWFAHANYL